MIIQVIVLLAISQLQLDFSNLLSEMLCLCLYFYNMLFCTCFNINLCFSRDIRAFTK